MTILLLIIIILLLIGILGYRKLAKWLIVTPVVIVMVLFILGLLASVRQ